MRKHIFTTWSFSSSKLPNFGKAVAVIISIILISITATAQPGALDLSFNPGTGADSIIWATAVQPDGKILIAGKFSSYNEKPANCIARLNSNGSLDTSFHSNPGIGILPGGWLSEKLIQAINIQQDGKIIIGGQFNSYNGDTSFNIARLHPDGTRDTTFPGGIRFRSQIQVTLTQPDGKIIVAGNFTLFDGNPAGRIMRLNADGSTDSSFTPGAGANASITCMALQSDNKILIGGSFSNYDGFRTFRVARLNADGTCDTTFNSSVGGAGSNVDAIVVQPDGRILLGGKFSDYNGVPAGRFLRVYQTGAVDFTFDQSIGANMHLNAIHIQPSGNYLIGGLFTQYKNVTVGRIAQIFNNGIADTLYNQNETGVNGDITELSPQGNKIITAGNFTSYNGIARGRIARLYNCLTSQPANITGDTLVNCPNTILTYSIATVPDAERYEWMLPNGWTGSSDSTTIQVVSNGKPGVVKVRAFSNACGYSFWRELNIKQLLPPPPAICLVTVDTASTHNIIIWEKQTTNLIDSFCIYRETSSNVYTKIASVPYDSLSEYHDYDANPNVTSYRYKLSTIDTCGVESDLSLYHSTIHLQNLSNGNFQWTFYQIEGQLNPILSFNFYRDNLSNNNFFPIGNIPGTNSTYTDLTYNSFPDANYVVDANWSIACTPSRAAINTTRSNIKKDKTGIFIGIDEAELKNALLIYPNPANGWLNITTKSSQLTAVALVNALGQTVWFEKESKSTFQVNTQSLPKGVYAVIAETDKGKVTIRIVLN